MFHEASITLIPKLTRTLQENKIKDQHHSVPWRRKWQPTPVFLSGEVHGQRSLVTYSPRGCKVSDTAKVLSEHSNNMGPEAFEQFKH